MITFKKNGIKHSLSNVAYGTSEGFYPTFNYYYQGAETTSEYPYTLFHFPGSLPYGEKIPHDMASYTDVYLVWDGKSKGMLVEQYD